MADNTNQPKTQNQGGQGQKNGSYQNRNRNYRNRNRNNNRPVAAAGAQTQQTAPKTEGQPSRPQNQNRGGKPHNRPKNYGNRFEGKKAPAVETVADIAADISRIEKEIELEIKEIGAMNLG